MARKPECVKDPAITTGTYEIYSDSSLKRLSKEELIQKLRSAEDGMQTAIAVSREVLDLVKGWTSIVTHCCHCIHEDFQWMPDGRVVAFCRCEQRLKGPLRGSDFCPYGEER